MPQQTTTLATGDLHDYVHAAWCLAISLLWPSEDFSDDDTVVALSDLQSYFSMAPDMEEAFKKFTIRVILAVMNEKKCPILHPLIWLNPVNISGLTHSKANTKAFQKMASKEPAFEQAITTLAKHYCEYIKYPTAATILKCKEQLESIGEEKWMGVFFDGLQRQPTI